MKRVFSTTLRYSWCVLYGLLLLLPLRHTAALEFAVLGPNSPTPPANVQLSGQAEMDVFYSGQLGYITYHSVGSDPQPGLVQFNFPDSTRPPRRVESFNAEFDFGQTVDNTSKGVDASFWYAPSSSGNPIFNGGLNVRYQCSFPDATDLSKCIATFTVSWHGQALASKAGIPVSGSLYGRVGSQFTHCRVAYSPINGLSVDLVSLDGSQTTNVLNGATLTWDAQPECRFLLSAVDTSLPPGGALVGVAAAARNVNILGQTAPYLQASIADRSSFQDFTDQFEFDLDTLEGHPESVTVRAQSSDPAVVLLLDVVVVSPHASPRRDEPSA